jgi:integrase
MASVSMLPSGRFRANAQVRTMRDTETFDRQADAKRWGEKTEARMREGTWVKKPKSAAADRGVTVKFALEQYYESEDWLNKRDITRQVERSKQKPVIAALGSRLLEELTPDDVRDYIAKRRKVKPKRAKTEDAKMSGDSIRLEVAALSAVCNFGIEHKWISTNPCRGVKRPKGSERKVRIPDELLGAILQHDAILGDERAYLFFRLLFTTVCRPGELAGAKREWLREDPPQISMPRTKNEDARSIIIPVHMLEPLKELMATQPGCPFIFGTPKLKEPGWSPYNYAWPWRKVRKDLGLAELGVVPHAGRHEGISRLFERTNLSDGQIAGLSGHRSAQALYRYKHLRNEHQRPIINALDQAVADAINRAITSLHPSEKLKPGQMMEPINDTMDESQAEVMDLTDEAVKKPKKRR